MKEKQLFPKLRALIKNLPEGFEECMGDGILTYVVPQSLYSNRYYYNLKLPLPFISLASPKKNIASITLAYMLAEVYHWFVTAHPKHYKQKLNRGKWGIRFKNITDIAHTLIGELRTKIAVTPWVELYEKNLKKNSVADLCGFFFKTKDPDATKTYYKNHLGLNTDPYDCTFWCKDKEGKVGFWISMVLS